MDIFLFLVTTLNNFLCPTTPRHSAVSIHQVDWADTLGRTASHPSPSCSHPIEVSQPSGNCPDHPSIQLPFASEPTSNRSPHRQQRRFTTHPQQYTNMPVPVFAHPQSLSFCRGQLTSPSHNLVISLPIVFTRQFCCEKTIQLLRGFKPGLQRWELAVLTTMLSFTVVWQIPELIYCY